MQYSGDPTLPYILERVLMTRDERSLVSRPYPNGLGTGFGGARNSVPLWLGAKERN